MSERFSIASHKGEYTVTFAPDALDHLNAAVPGDAHFVLDRRVAELYAASLDRVLSSGRALMVDATESNKSLDRFPAYVETLVGQKIRRDHYLIAVGGGITQDITCFLAATLMRGIDWKFYPTTLLAQTDSCIGSKSSINVGKAKNILGTFTPPREVFISTDVLMTLDRDAIRSGIGEMLKAHIIDGPDTFDRLSLEFSSIETDPSVMGRCIRRSLMIKKRFIEADEFDRDVRNIFNYGHSFGHAIESATDFAVPHGVAVTIGMDMANFIALQKGMTTAEHYARMHPVLAANYAGFSECEISFQSFWEAMAKDKKILATN